MDIGTVMTHKIMLPTGHYVCRNTVRGWAPVEEASKPLKEQKAAFTAQLHESLGAACEPADFDPNDLTP